MTWHVRNALNACTNQREHASNCDKCHNSTDLPSLTHHPFTGTRRICSSGPPGYRDVSMQIQAVPTVIRGFRLRRQRSHVPMFPKPAPIFGTTPARSQGQTTPSPSQYPVLVQHKPSLQLNLPLRLSVSDSDATPFTLPHDTQLRLWCEA